MIDTKLLTKEFSVFLKTARENAGLSVRALAAAAGVSASNISAWENHPERFSPSPLFLYKISGPLNVSFSELLYYAGYMPPRKSDFDDTAAIAKNSLAVASIKPWIGIEESKLKMFTLIEYLSTLKGISISKLNIKFQAITQFEYGYSENLLSQENIGILCEFAITDLLIKLAHIFFIDVDLFLFLFARIPDKFTNAYKYFTFGRKINIFKQSLQETDVSMGKVNRTKEDYLAYWQKYFSLTREYLEELKEQTLEGLEEKRKTKMIEKSDVKVDDVKVELLYPQGNNEHPLVYISGLNTNEINQLITYVSSLRADEFKSKNIPLSKNKCRAGELSFFLRQKREERGLSVRALAEMAGISYSNYSTLENNPERPTASLATLYKFPPGIHLNLFR